MPGPRRRILAVLAALGLLVAVVDEPSAAVRQAAPEHPRSEAVVPDPQPDAGSGSRSIGLADTIGLARRRSPLVRAEELQVEAAELDVRRVEDILQLPELKLDGRTGLVPEARGTILDSPDDQNDLDGLGPFVQLDVGLTMPIFGWGRLDNVREAARSGLNARAAERDAAADELALQVSRAYWGLAAATEAVQLAAELRDEYGEILEELEDKLAADEIDNTDAYEIQALRYDIEKTWQDASFDRHRARAALVELLGLDPDVELTPEDEPSPELGIDESATEALVERAARSHPQLRALRSAVDVLDARMGLERSERGPLFVLGGLFGFAHAGNRVDQSNPFVYDPWNRLTLGAGVGFQWDLNFARHSLQIARARIERDATEAQARALRSKVGIDVRQAYRRVAQNYELLGVARDTRRVTRRWLRVAADNWDLGIGEAETLLKAYQQDYRLQGLVIERQYELNVSLAELAAALGEFDLYLRWFRDGQVVLD